MDCCVWQRSQNDALYDSDTGHIYCGTCWQKWIAFRRTAWSCRSKKFLGSNAFTEARETENCALVADAESLGELEGVHHENTLYLVSRSKGLIFASEREADGRLRCVGEIGNTTGKSEAIKLYDSKSGSEGSGGDTLPFAVDPQDHCETPFDAYEDLSPYLRFLAGAMGKEVSNLLIWDPYYCDGGVKRNLRRLGFCNVHNECEDFYRIVKGGKLPAHDCIVTNPPYSTEPVDHVHELFKILCAQPKPWFVVQPNYVYTKLFWEELTSNALAAPRPFFLTPHTPRKYKYKTPVGMRPISSKQLKTSPFVSMWYCWLGPKHTERFYRWVSSKPTADVLPLTLACTEYFVPDCFKDSSDKTRRKPQKSKKRKADTNDTSVDISSKRSKNEKKV